MSGTPPPLAPQAARVFYAVADAWLEPQDGDDPLAVGDPVAGLGKLGLAARALRRLGRLLALLEWSPRLALRSRCGLAWLPREERRAWLARLAVHRSAWLRRSLAELRAIVERSQHATASSQSRPGP